ncbi:MAG: hypothetical protein JWP28_2655 [Phenylobacterium sp.]|jgi:hypothetical protein|uniref:hypothetical protein n=1 Tax=Phenylobacterium sp. TaxID=1871053 RepID=UPI00263A135A|nr:hypothetical protein [Phenylobacterium sp.]MDB5428290.1 hypothetical protein [Phenylobacterium sp.]MDB5498624.1 hypothetical protein [Phenylobacterium sp.]
MSDSSRPADPPRPVLNATRARQGRFGRHMVWVLVFSTLLAAIGLFLAWTWKAPSLASANSDNGRASAAKAFSAPEPAAVVPPPGTDHTAPQAP